jgi:hypothetical protein
MMRSFLLALLLAFGADAASMRATFAHDYKVGPLEIKHPWSRATPKGASVAGGYLTVVNTGTTSDRLIGGSSAVAGRFEIHQMRTIDGVMQMRALPAGIEIKPGQAVELKPGSFHLMFMPLKRPLETGERVKGTLVFEKAGTIEVEYAIEAIGASPSNDPAHRGH